ncbi:bestrophin-like domain [Streptomyces sp. O3]
MSHVIEMLALGLVAAIAVAAGVLLWRRYQPVADDEDQGEEAGEYMSMMVSLLYALLLALALVNVWEVRDDADVFTNIEAGALHQLTVLSDGMPPEQDKQIDDIAQRYAAHVVQQEWPLLADRAPLGDEGWRLLRQLRPAALPPAESTAAQQVTSLQMLSQLGELDYARRERADAAEETLSPILWVAIFVGAALSITFLFFFRVRGDKTHVSMVMGMVALTVFLILLISHMSEPFGSVMGIGPDAFLRYFPEAETASSTP